MIDSFIFSLNAIAPIFVIVVIGYMLKKADFINDNFLAVCDRLVFKICLPCLLFVDISEAESGQVEIGLIIFAVGSLVVIFALLCATVPLFIKDNAQRGAFIQGVFRSNAAILGLTVATNMFGEIGSSTVGMILPFIVSLFNVFAVIILSLCAPEDARLSHGELVKRIVKTIALNPLIIAIVLALLWRVTGIEMPVLADRSLGYLSDMAMPLALISLGANFTFESLRGRVGLAVLSSSLRTIVVPTAVVVVAILFGYKGVELASLFIVFGGPAAVSSYIMAKQMKSDYQLASQILLISTLMSLFTMFAGIFILKATGLV